MPLRTKRRTYYIVGDMGIKIKGKNPTAFRYGGKIISGIASGERVVWRAGHTITLGVNPNDIAKVRDVEGTGDVISKVVSSNRDYYTFIVCENGEINIQIIPVDGFQVDTLNVDKVGQGEADTYDFKAVTTDHTMYVWMKEAPAFEYDVDFLMRSDTEKIYSSLNTCLSEVRADYPDGLTKDITVYPIKEAVCYRNSPYETGGYRNLDLRDFNTNSVYTLTIDGKNLLTIDGYSLGGLFFEDCDNIIIKNLKFRNVATFEKAYAPETYACIRAVSQKARLRNFYIENVTINGLSTINGSSHIRHGFQIGGYQNVTITNCKISYISVCALSIGDAKSCHIRRSNISGEFIYGDANNSGGHANLINITPSIETYIEDNDISGKAFGETLINIGKCDKIILRRNKIHDCSGPVMYVSSEIESKHVEVSNNHIYNVNKKPLYQWDCQMFLYGNCDTAIFASNLVLMNSTYFNEFFYRAGSNIKNLVNVNNIYIRTSSVNTSIFNISVGSEVENLVAQNNIYKSNDGVLFYSIPNKGLNERKFAGVQSKGYETGSVLLSTDTKILISESGGTRNCLTSEYAALHKSLSEYVGEYDKDYKINDPENTSVGAYNYYSIDFDEAEDKSEGYTGYNMTSLDTISSSVQAVVPAEDLLYIVHSCKNRDKFIKLEFYEEGKSTPTYINYGARSVVSIMPNLDENGEYVSDKLYNMIVK